MRRTKNITKRVAIAILAATMMMTTVSVSVAQPVTVWARDLGVNNGEYDTVEPIDTVTENNSDLDSNRGYIETNNANIRVNDDGSIAGTNNPDAEGRGTINPNNNTGSVNNTNLYPTAIIIN